MKKNNIDTLMEQALKSNEVPPPALVSHVKSMSARQGSRVRRRLLSTLVAAALCLMFIVGAAALTNLFGLQDLLLPDITPAATETSSTPAAPTAPTVPTDDIPIQLISLQGIAGTPEHAAATAWHKFMRSYDPDRTLIAEADAAFGAYMFGDADYIPAQFDIPHEYRIYGAYTMEMVEKIHEIAERYNLALLGDLMEVHSKWRDLDSVNQWLLFQLGHRFDSGTFFIDGLMGNTPFQLRASAKGVFDYVLLNIGDYAGFSEWIYVNEHENQLLLLQSEYKSLIFFDGEDAFFAMNILVGTKGNDLNSQIASIDRAELEVLADTIDFARLWADSFAAFEPTPEPTPEQTQETAPPESDYAISLADILGDWNLSHSVNEAGEVGMPIYSDWITYTLEILADSSFLWSAYGDLWGDLTQIDDYTFEASSLVATSEGMTWNLEGDIVTITYIPETGQLHFVRIFLWEHGPTADPLSIYYKRG